MPLIKESTFERALRVLAGGVDSPVRAGRAVCGPPPSIARALGSRVYDDEGRAYVDYVCAYGAVLLGHADARISDAVCGAATRGTVWGTTHAEEVRLAERLRSRMPSMERLRFVSTGTEAIASAVRLARGFTARQRIVRFAGNYHGHADEMIFSAGASSHSDPSRACGVPAAAQANVTVLPYCDLGALEHELELRGNATAAVILEPVCGNMGLVVPDDGYLRSVRTLCERCGALLIFDEVITGFRLGPGGAQTRAQVTPDLTCIGKTLGGGLPIAAFGGRSDVMGVLSPDGAVFQGGTFSGNPLCVAAAHAFLDALESEPAFYERVERLARRLASGAAAALAALGLPYPVVQTASIVDFMFRAGGPHRTLAQARQADEAAYARYYRAMLERGVFLPPSPMEVMFVSGAHTDEDIETTVAAIGAALAA